MDESVMRERVSRARVARLGTVTAGGGPHLVPCCFALDGDHLFTGVDDVKPKSTAALRRLDNIRRDPRISVLVDRYEEDWSTLWWVRMDGEARVVDGATDDGQRAWRLLIDKYEQYRGVDVTGPLIAVAVSRWVAWP